MPWDEIHRRACILEAEGNAHDVDIYATADVQVHARNLTLSPLHGIFSFPF